MFKALGPHTFYEGLENEKVKKAERKLKLKIKRLSAYAHPQDKERPMLISRYC